jgi:hypothetical protein
MERLLPLTMKNRFESALHASHLCESVKDARFSVVTGTSKEPRQ